MIFIYVLYFLEMVAQAVSAVGRGYDDEVINLVVITRKKLVLKRKVDMRML